MTAGLDDRKLVALVDLIGRTGAKDFAIQWTELERQPPKVAWIASASHGKHLTIGAALEPVQAAYRLAEQLIDGGECTHCHRMTGVDEDPFASKVFDDAICFYRYDPELKTFRRTCEGAAT